jgi:predicted Zn-ribbon and HTH transcriptional regulator
MIGMMHGCSAGASKNATSHAKRLGYARSEYAKSIHFHGEWRKDMPRAKCFRCKKTFQARNDQHKKYSYCPRCKSLKEDFESGSSWIDYRMGGRRKA